MVEPVEELHPLERRQVDEVLSESMVESGQWVKNPETGLLDYLPSSNELKRRNKKKRKAKAKNREKKEVKTSRNNNQTRHSIHEPEEEKKSEETEEDYKS